MRAPPRFGLANTADIVVISEGAHDIGTTLDAVAVRRGIPLVIDGARRGTILIPSAPIPEAALRALGETRRALWLSLAAALLTAIALGAGMARALTGPLRTLTAAAQAMAAGHLGQQVDVRGPRELETLGASFNRMSADVARATELRRRMTADVAHELRTPITVLSGYLEALAAGELSPTPDRVAAMHVEARRLNRLVEDLRLLSLAEARELPIRKERVSLDMLVEDLRAAFATQASAASVALEVDVAQDLPEVWLDADRMAQVLSNLVANALRHTPARGTVRIKASVEAGAARLAVTDTGSGIPPQALPQVFDRFYRVDSARSADSGGSGLGLAIARSLVEAHGGTIVVTSEVARGTTFTIELPDAGTPRPGSSDHSALDQAGGAKR